MRLAGTQGKPLEEFVPRDPYKDWQAREGVKVIEGHAFPDLIDLELSPWERKGGWGAIINIPCPTLLTDAHVVEITPAGQSQPEHHLYEEQVYILSGRGSTSIWVEGRAEQRLEWAAGALFAIPLNAWYRHVNLSGTDPARYVAVTNAPPMMRLLADEDAVFNSPMVFRSRFQGERGYFWGPGKLYQHRVWQANVVPNASDATLYSWKQRGGGGANVQLEMAGNSAVKCHISETPVGTYKKAHRHGPGYHLVILSGTGFTLFWTQADMSDLRKFDWRKNGLFIVPSDACFHQHFNTGTTRARYLAIRPGTMGVTAPSSYRRPNAGVDITEGGWQVEYKDEARKVHEIFETALAGSGVTCRMKGFIPWCTGNVGPRDE